MAPLYSRSSLSANIAARLWLLYNHSVAFPDLTSAERQLIAMQQAALAIAEDLSLADTLRRIVTAAAHLVGARYAALGVPDEHGERLVEFVTTGLSSEEEARIPHRPRGDGLLGVILRDGVSLRLRDLRRDPRSAGFPPNHPPMRSFLGVPIVIKGQRLGNLYLTEKEAAAEFSEADQKIIELLATHAAIAIQNARLYRAEAERSHELRERNRELAALNAVAAATSQYLDLQQVLVEALNQALRATQAEVGEIFLLEESSGDMVLALHRGPFQEAFHSISRFKRGEGYPGRVAETGETLSSAQLSLDVHYLRSQVVEAGFEAYACVPLLAKGKVVGTLDLASRNAGLFDQASLNLLAGIGRQIGVAIENARLHQQVAQLAVLEERQRIGMDLHDGVIQSIYAVGLTLEYARGQLIDGDASGADERIQAAMEALNTTIRDIRAYILDLRPRRFGGDDLVEGLRRLLAEFKANTLMMVEFNSDPAANDALTAEARRALFLIAQESLSNVARHSRASRVEASLVCAANTVQLTIADNGRGFDPTRTKHALGHGLSNMRDRAQAIGGEVSIVSPPNGGTAVHISVPRVLSA